MPNKIKYLVTGGSGNLGTHLCPKIKCLTPSKEELDILNVAQIEKFVSLDEINAVLHMAAIADTTLADKNKKMTYEVNVKGTANIASAAKRFNKKIIYISTDYVFPCTEDGYKEIDQPQPFNWYGFTKYAGELEIQNSTDNYLIIRTSFRPVVWPFPTAYSDIYTSADYIDVIAAELALCLNQATDLMGIIHIGTPTKTLYELAKKRNPDVLPEKSNDNKKNRTLSLEKWQQIKNQLL